MKPLLLVDAGNSRIKWAIVPSGHEIVMKGEMDTREASASTIRGIVKQFPGHQVILASVVPQVTAWFQESGGPVLTLTADTPGLPLIFEYPNPAQLGADRLAAALAATMDKVFPCIIVSCGTASAFSVLDSRGKFCGGAIAPGPQTQIDSLDSATAQLPAIALAGPGSLPAKSTEEAIRAGVTLSFQGGAKEIIAGLTRSLEQKPRILLTGGHAVLLESVIPGAEHRPLLVFEGLRIIGQRQSAARSS